MLPVVTEVVFVKQSVADVDENLIEAYLIFRDAFVTVIDGERTKVVLGLAAVIPGTATEPVQMRICPAERGLHDLVHLVEKQIGCEFQTPPHRWFGVGQIGPHPQRHRLRTARSAARRRLGRSIQLLDRPRPGRSQVLRKPLDIGRPESVQQLVDDPLDFVILARHSSDARA